MVEDVPTNYEDGKLPVLDFKIWKVETVDEEGKLETQIRTEFFEKSMVGKRTLMKRSAIPTKVKIASLAQMVVRRCANQVGGGPKSLRTIHLSKLMNKMRVSGYDTAGRVEVLLSGMRGVLKKWKRMKLKV